MKNEICFPYSSANSSSSTTSNRLSPDSHFETKDCGRFIARAASACVSPDCDRASLRRASTYWYAAECTELNRSWAGTSYTLFLLEISQHGIPLSSRETLTSASTRKAGLRTE